MFHYDRWSPCISRFDEAPNIQAPGLCSSDEVCNNNPATFSLQEGFYDSFTYGSLLGLARDGHLVYGPYNPSGELWSKDEHDNCNGAFLDDGSYVYVSSATDPNLVNCWGPEELCNWDWFAGNVETETW